MSDFDAYVESYQEAVDHGISFSRVEHAVFLRAKAGVLLDVISTLGPVSELSLLDVGCGIGAFSSHVANDVGSLHGVDVSAGAVARATRDLPGATFASYDGLALPYKAGCFDVAFAVCVLHHVERRDRLALVFEMRRVVRPGGLVVLFEHNPWNPLTRLVVRRVSFDEGVELLPVREATLLLTRASLRPVRSRFILFAPSASRRVRAVEKTLGWLPLGAQYVAVGHCA